MKFFNLQNTAPLINLNGRCPKFNNRNFSGFRPGTVNLLEKLIHELEIRNFNVEGFDVEFTLRTDTAGISVFRITNDTLDFKLVSDHQINIPKMELSVHHDSSGSLYVYAGDNWEEENKEFVNGKKFHRRMDGLPRLYLQYDLRGWGARFEATTDGREHYPQEEERTTYTREEIEIQFVDYINYIVIPKIQSYPLPAEQKNVFIEPEPVALTNELFKDVTLYTFSDKFQDSDDRAKQGIGPNKRLLNLGIKLPDHPLKNEMHDGFIYMEMCNHKSAAEIPTKPKDTDDYSYGYDSSRQKMYRICPKNYNNFYVVDASVFNRLKSEYFTENPSEKRLSNEMCDFFLAEQARTMVPINEYKGGYEKPIVITNRQIWPEEMILVETPVENYSH